MSDIIQINKDTWRIEDGGVRFFLLAGTESALLIDSGMQTPNAREIAQSVTMLPLQLLNTHTDRDHISGNGSFDTVMMGIREEALYRANGGAGTVVPLKGGDVLDLGDRPLEIIDLPGHTPGSIAILDVTRRVLIGGDSIQDGRIFMFGSHRNMSDYIESMEQLSQHDGRYDEIWPSHSNLPVAADMPAKLIGAARQILSGEAKGDEIDMFGRTVTLYQFEFAGFLCER